MPQNTLGQREHVIRTLDLEISGRGERTRPVDINLIAAIERVGDFRSPLFISIKNEGTAPFTFRMDGSDDPATDPFAGSEGTITFNGAIVDAETVTVSDGTNAAVVFEFDSNASVVNTPVLRQVVIVSNLPTVYANLRATLRNLIDAINVRASEGTFFIDAEDFTVQHGGFMPPAPVALLTNRQTGAVGDVALTEASANIAVVGMLGGTAPLTFNEFVTPGGTAVTTLLVRPGAIVQIIKLQATQRYLRLMALPENYSVTTPEGTSRPFGHVSIAYWMGKLEEYERSNLTASPQLDRG